MESTEISSGVVLDFDSEGNLTGIDIDNAGTKLDLIDYTRCRTFPLLVPTIL